MSVHTQLPMNPVAFQMPEPSAPPPAYMPTINMAHCREATDAMIAATRKVAFTVIPSAAPASAPSALASIPHQVHQHQAHQAAPHQPNVVVINNNPQPAFMPMMPMFAPAPQPIIINNGAGAGRVGRHAQQAQDQRNRDTQNVIIGIVGFAIAAVSAFFIGKAMAEGENDQAETSEYASLKDQWHSNRAVFDYQFASSVDKAVRSSDAIIERKRIDKICKTVAIVLFATTGALLLVGALASCNPLIITGVALAALTIIAGLGRLGYRMYSNSDQRDAQAILDTTAQLRAPRLG